MSIRYSKWIVPTALALAVTSAWGGQITLYERPEFRGPSVVANERIDAVATQGLGDTASSLVVTDGKWQVCTQDYYRGRCMELLPGSYPGISVTLNGRIASARQIGYADPMPVTMSPPPIVVNPRVETTVQPPVVTRSTMVSAVPTTGRAYLYEDPNFGGAWVAVDRGEANDLDWAHFNNPAPRATSVRVESGTWLLCTDMAFRGDCRVFGPGEYPQLTGPMMAGISSARQVWYPEHGSADVYRRW